MMVLLPIRVTGHEVDLTENCKHFRGMLEPEIVFPENFLMDTVTISQMGLFLAR